ncbi:alternative ribosome rescue aminoacyl-tRNA hydrolase ArfB [Chthonobacter rhizosphaerae]|uniref:alternative ribosome rescue aminoacyl-tRNA hydrolase ArfB n=1 Tax=Chthonobacter rhizosphaerae TaxID=2735553 RepID=UPI0015EF9331|nr:alternative ribosome rescue aminoacyl-tRNA hydrolase ArfB [Chthonobacter rhizosphaerae]
MIRVTDTIHIDERDLSESFVQASGPGGQNVNKVATAVSLRYDLYNAAGIPWDVKVRAARIAGRKVTREGAIVITAQRHRTQERNRADALERLVAILREAAVPPKPRVATKPTYSSKVRRLEGKARRSSVKRHRQSPADD